MKVAFVIDNPRIIGGGDYALYKYAEQLALRGHEVDVYGQYFNEFMDQLAPSPNFRLTLRGGVPPGIKGAGRVNRIWDRLYTRVLLEPRLRRSGRAPDVIIGYHRVSAVKAARLGRRLGIPAASVVFESPAWLAKVFGEKYRRTWTGALAAEWDEVRTAYRDCAVLFPLASVVQSEVAEWIGKPVGEPIYCGVNDPGMPAGDVAAGGYILYIGRLDINKNVHEIIDAVSRLNPSVKLVVAGGGYEENDLRRRASERGIVCEFAGHITDEEKWRLIRGCLFMVFPSSFEGFGIPPAEALVCGKPCICSDIPILREVYGDYVESVREHDVDHMAETMRMLLADPAYRKQRGLAGRDYVIGRYTWAKCAERMEAGLMALVR